MKRRAFLTCTSAAAVFPTAVLAQPADAVGRQIADITKKLIDVTGLCARHVYKGPPGYRGAIVFDLPEGMTADKYVDALAAVSEGPLTAANIPFDIFPMPYQHTFMPPTGDLYVNPLDFIQEPRLLPMLETLKPRIRALIKKPGCAPVPTT